MEFVDTQVLVHLHSSVNVSQIQKAPSFLKNIYSLIKNREFLFGSVVLGMNDTKLHLLKNEVPNSK